MTTEHNQDKVLFGFWVYLMTDLIMFAVLFAAYAVLRNNTASGPSGAEIFQLPAALKQTLVLLTSTFTVGLAQLAVFAKRKYSALFWFGITFILGLTFLVLELTEFSHLIAEGNSWTRSAFLSSFFALTGTHGLHIFIGLLWMIVAMCMVYYRGITPFLTSKLIRLGMFWHFLDIVWIFIFTFVYLYGHI